jgi:type I restriction enzyme S subunit
MKIGHIHRMSMNPCGLRFDSSYHLSDGVTVKRNIAASPYPFMLIGKAAERIFIGGRARRVYVKDRKHEILLGGRMNEFSYIKMLSSYGINSSAK